MFSPLVDSDIIPDLQLVLENITQQVDRTVENIQTKGKHSYQAVFLDRVRHKYLVAKMTKLYHSKYTYLHVYFHL